MFFMFTNTLPSKTGKGLNGKGIHSLSMAEWKSGSCANNCDIFTGHGKNHKDAASVRATHPIPAACGLYYYEVKIVSKGRDGWVWKIEVL